MGGSHHHHHHDHNHHHSAPSSFQMAFFIAVVANGLFVAFQIVAAIYANSTSLLADAFHNLGDVLGLIMSWIANGFLKRSPTEKSTYGMKKTTILAAFANGILLVFTCGVIATEALYKFIYPSEIHAFSIMLVAGLGILINGSTAMLFSKGQDDLNIRSAYLHLFYDALISLGVVLAAILLYWTNWLWIDPAVGLIIAIVILKGTWSLFKDSLSLLLDGVPREISLSGVRDLLRSEAGVVELHDLHIWALSTKENALSVHLYMPEHPLGDQARYELIKTLKVQHNIHHATIQVERNLSFCEDAC